MKIVKPMRLGLLHRTYLYQREHRFVITPLCFFKLGSEKEILIENLQWPVIMSCLDQGQVLDMGMPKVRSEILIAGNAYAPDKKPITSMYAGFSFGNLQKLLRVNGDREWQWHIAPSYNVTPCKPFTQMPLHYSRAYGGSGYSLNPQGQGYRSRRTLWFGKRIDIRLPNIEYPGESFTKLRKRYRMAGFAPLDLNWPQRKNKAGTYNKHWLQHDYPGFPRDIDWSIFNAAPDDQQYNGFIRGDEAYCLMGMHPQKKTLSGNLPGIKARSFVNRKTDAGLQFEEVPLHAETVWFFPEKEIGVLLFRGEIPVQDSDALDIEHIMIGYENMQDTARAVEYYQDVLAKRIHPKTAIAHVFNDAQLSPIKSVKQQAQEQAETEAMRAKELQQKQQQIDASVAEIFSKEGMEIPPGFKHPQAEPNPLSMIPLEAIKRGDFDLSEIIEKAEALAIAAEAQGKQKMQALEAEQKNLQAQVSALTEQANTPADAIKRVQELRAQVMQLPFEMGGLDSESTETLLQALSNSQASAGKNKDESQSTRQTLRNAATQSRKARQVSPKPIKDSATLSTVDRRSLRTLFLELHAKGEVMAGRDFAGVDLSGLDFTGLDLREVMLENADLSNCRFDYCNMESSVLTGAVLDNASFRQANLKKINLSEAGGVQVNFEAAIFAEASLMNAVLKACCFDLAVMTKTNFMQATLNGSSLKKCVFNDALLIETKLENSCCTDSEYDRTVMINAVINNSQFDRSRFNRVALINVRADSCSFRAVNMTKVQAGGESSFQRSDFSTAHTVGCGWRNVNFKTSLFRAAVMAQSDFGNAKLQGSDFRESVLYRSIFSGACLHECDFQDADLFEALLRKADFTCANLKNANLYNADLSEVNFTDACLDGARSLNPIKSKVA